MFGDKAPRPWVEFPRIPHPSKKVPQETPVQGSHQPHFESSSVYKMCLLITFLCGLCKGHKNECCGAFAL